MSHTEATVNHTAQAGAHAAGHTTGHTASREVVVTEDGRVLNDPTHAKVPGHGNSPAAWAMAGLVVLGFLAGCIGLLNDALVFVWIGVAVMVVGVLVGIVGGKAAGRSDH